MTTTDILLPRTAADTEGSTNRILAKLEQSGHINDILRLMANSENGFRPFVLMSNALLMEARLPGDVREVVVLWLAKRRGVSYQWAEHVGMSVRAGVTDAQRDALQRGEIEDAKLFSYGQRLALRIATQMLDGAEVTLETWSEMCREWTKAGALDLAFSIAWWGGFVPLVINAVRAHGLTDKHVG